MRRFALICVGALAGCLSVARGGRESSTTAASPGPGGCAPGAHFIGDICVLDACTASSPILPCILGDGGLGTCASGACLSTSNDPHNCGSPGAICPRGGACAGGTCVIFEDGGWTAPPPFRCDCPAGTQCVGETCAHVSCGAGDDDLICTTGPCFTNDCPTGFCCHGQCLGENDPADCGGCGATCPATLACAESGCIPFGSCAPDGGAATCKATSGRAGLCCEGLCADPMADPLNCGGCGFICPSGSGCNAGICLATSCSQTTCPGDELCINEGLIKARWTSPEPYVPDFVCVDPVCSAEGNGETCLLAANDFHEDDATLGMCCGARCLALDDRGNCGACGTACDPLEVCTLASGFACVAPPVCGSGQGPCVVDGGRGGACCGGACVDFDWDSDNCGGCGLGCVAGADCIGGVCEMNGYPIGGCGHGFPCPAGRVCFGGACEVTTCLEDHGECSLDGGSEEGPGHCCGTACVDFAGDVRNCGECGQVCRENERCSFGVCTGPAGPSHCPEDPCPAGSACRNGACVVRSACAGVQNEVQGCLRGPGVTGTCCFGQCVDPNQDPANCGFCGTACASGICASSLFELIVGGPGAYLEGAACLPEGPSTNCEASCAPGTLCVNGGCVPPALGTSPACLAVDGTIGLRCANGACSHPRDDSQNCGLCGNACPFGVACVDGACQGSTCGIGHWGNFCGDAGERTCCPGADCTDTLSDSLNCGGCGLQCLTGSRCVGGSCR